MTTATAKKEAAHAAALERHARARKDLIIVDRNADRAIEAYACPSCDAPRGAVCQEPIGKTGKRWQLGRRGEAHHQRIALVFKQENDQPRTENQMVLVAEIDRAHLEALELERNRAEQAKEIAEALASAPAQKPNRWGWVRVDERPWKKTRAVWVHPSGWILEHCGHPTALHPWALFNPMGDMVLAGAKFHCDPTKGYAWDHLEDAQAWVAQQIPATAAEENASSPCAHCGKPTIRGVNSAFCSERCEREAQAPTLFVLLPDDPPPAPPARDPAWRGLQLDLFQLPLP